MDYSYLSKILDTYSLEEIIDYNELTEEDVLSFLLEQDYLSLPDIMPVDLNE